MYIVMAYRGGDTDRHSYVAAIHEDLEKAKAHAEKIEYHRGGKYSCVVNEHVDPSAGFGSETDATRVYETEAFKMDHIVIMKKRHDIVSNMSYYEDEQDYIKLLQAALKDVPFLTTDDHQVSAKVTRDAIQKQLGSQLDSYMRIAKQNKKIVALAR